MRFSLLSALSTHNDDPRSASKPFSKNRQGFVMAEGAGAARTGEPGSRAIARREDLGRDRRLWRVGGHFPSYTSQPRQGPNRRLHPQRSRRCKHGLRSDRLHQRSRNEYARERQDGISRRRRRVRRSCPQDSGLIQQIDSRTHLSAAGIIEAVFTLLTLEHQRISPTINYDVPDPAIPFDVVPNRARDARITAAMSNSVGFGGQNVSLIIRREPG